MGRLSIVRRRNGAEGGFYFERRELTKSKTSNSNIQAFKLQKLKALTANGPELTLIFRRRLAGEKLYNFRRDMPEILIKVVCGEVWLRVTVTGPLVNGTFMRLSVR